MNFATSAFGGTVRSMAIGAAYHNAGDGGAALDQWYWRVRDDEPFVYYGQNLPLGWPPETMLIVR